MIFCPQLVPKSARKPSKSRKKTYFSEHELGRLRAIRLWQLTYGGLSDCADTPLIELAADWDLRDVLQPFGSTPILYATKYSLRPVSATLFRNPASVVS